MKNYQEYDFQRLSAHNKDDQLSSNAISANTVNSCCELRLNALEQRIDELEKKVHYYEELISIKDKEINQYEGHSNLIDDTIKRITEIEELLVQLNFKNNYTLQAIDIENIIEGKLNIQHLIIDTKLNDLSLMMQDLSKYNVSQQKQYSNTQELLTQFNDRLSSNTIKINDLYKQLKALQSSYNETNSEEEELFFQNIQRN